jgi:hypothetical protein
MTTPGDLEDILFVAGVATYCALAGLALYLMYK